MKMFRSKRLALRSKSGGVLGSLLLVLVLSAVLAFLLTNPQAKDFVRRSINETVRVFSQEKKQAKTKVAVTPSPTPDEAVSPEETPAAAAEPTQPSSPKAVVESSPTPAPITLADIAAAPESWPKSVHLTREVEFPVIVDGKPVGKMTVSAGREFKCSELQGEKVTVEHMGARIAVPIIATDFMARAVQTLSDMRSKPNPATAAKAPEEVSAAPMATSVRNSALLEWLEPNLVILKGSSIEPAAAGCLNKVRYLVIYFASISDGPCRRMTPALKEFYLQKKAEGAPFEMVLVSQDSNAGEMESFIKEHQLPWPALKWDEVITANDINKYAGGNLPGLVLIDADGEFITSSTQNGHYMGPSVVLEEINKRCKR